MTKYRSETARLTRILEINAEIARLNSEQRALIERGFVQETITAKAKVTYEVDRDVMESLRTADIAFARVEPSEQRVRLADVLEMTGATKRTIYRWMDDPDMSFPRPTIDRRTALWSKREVELWLENHQTRMGRWPASPAR